jgi:hypothetical protein
MTIRTAEDMREATVGICAALLEREYDAETGDSIYGILDAIRALPVASEWRPIGEVPACGDNDLVEIYLANPDPVSSLGIKIVPAWCWPFHGSATHWRPHVAPGGAA